MKHRTIMPLLISSLLLVFFISAINLQHPVDAQAGPLAGFTPIPDDGDDDGDDGGDETNPPPTSSQPEGPGPGGREPTDYVDVQLSQCDLSCSAETASEDRPGYEPLAYSVDETAGAPLLIPLVNDVASFEIIAPVRLVHDGSGFITIGKISTHHSSRFVVPYPGQWEVFLTGLPQLMTAEVVNMSNTTLAQLEATLADEPISMGIVEANTETSQMVKCPLECVINEAPPAVETPLYLPMTGVKTVSPFLIGLIGFGLVLLAIWIHGAGLTK